MILKVNTHGISIDVSFSQEATDKFEAKKATIMKDSINVFKVCPDTVCDEEVILLRDVGDREYFLKCEDLVSINGELGLLSDPNSLYDTNIKLFDKVNELLCNL